MLKRRTSNNVQPRRRVIYLVLITEVRPQSHGRSTETEASHLLDGSPRWFHAVVHDVRVVVSAGPDDTDHPTEPTKLSLQVLKQQTESVRRRIRWITLWGSMNRFWKKYVN